MQHINDPREKAGTGFLGRCAVGGTHNGGSCPPSSAVSSARSWIFLAIAARGCCWNNMQHKNLPREKAPSPLCKEHTSPLSEHSLYPHEEIEV